MKISRYRLSFLSLSAVACLICVVFTCIFVVQLSVEIRSRFDGKRWSLPAVVYARSLELFPGREFSANMLEEELQLAGYRLESEENGPGSYSRSNDTIFLVSRDFFYPTGLELSQHLEITFSGEHISSLYLVESQKSISYVRLDPARIGSFHPLVHEDRVILNLDQTPELLIKSLLAVEDRKFYSHMGISPMAITRAFSANIKAGKIVQGGSTLTQQLVKNLFLSRERTLLRKLQEVVMALLLEFHYTKDEILMAYINEVFMGQDGNRAIHGFGLASQFYFRRDLKDLRADQIAVLVGMVKGPSYYDPRRKQENCLNRRKTVLNIMAQENLINHADLVAAQLRPLIKHDVQKSGFNRFPAFLDLVRIQLASEFKEEDLKTNGLQILTTLDPQIQYKAEQGLQTSIAKLQKSPKDDQLEGAAIITSRVTGEVLALTGSKNPQLLGFNRALYAKRPIGSLIKPAVYLAALNKGYSLATPLEDKSLDNTSQWAPENYDRKEHGTVALYAALAHSYNLATIQLGMALGLEHIINTIHDLGFTRELSRYPSLLLGALAMSPFEVSQMYQTIASGGFFTSLRAIDSVMAADHNLLNRYGLAMEQRFSPQSNYLLVHALQRAMKEGTGKSLLLSSLKDYGVAGKTGTSDKLRDSWFAGFTGDHLGVVWLGHDDNTPANLTGSSGALKVWKTIMEDIKTSPLKLVEPVGISWRRIDLLSLERTNMLNIYSTLLPFVDGLESAVEPSDVPEDQVEVVGQEEEGLLDTMKSWFQ